MTLANNMTHWFWRTTWHTGSAIPSLWYLLCCRSIAPYAAGSFWCICRLWHGRPRYLIATSWDFFWPQRPSSPLALVLPHSPCHLVPSIRWILATVIVNLLHVFRSLVASLSSGSFIFIVSCISSIHLLLGRPLPRLPSPHASIISFSSPSARITCPKYVTFCLAALCLNVISPLKCPISSSICSFVLFSVQGTLNILLQIHISHASIFFSSALVFVHASHPYSTTGIIIALAILAMIIPVVLYGRLPHWPHPNGNLRRLQNPLGNGQIWGAPGLCPRSTSLPFVHCWHSCPLLKTPVNWPSLRGRCASLCPWTSICSACSYRSH